MAESTPNFVTLHRDADRHEFFTADRAKKPFFDPLSKAWIVAEPAQCRELAASSKLRPDTFSENTTTLGRHLKIDFSALAFAMDQVPLCLHGEQHMRARRAISEFLASRKTELSAKLAGSIETHFACLREPGDIELMNRAITPFVLDVLSTMIDVDICKSGEAASLLFDKALGVSKRRRIAAEVAELREMIAHRLGKPLTDEDAGMRLALVLVGRDSLIGTLGESLLYLFEGNRGVALNRIDYPQMPPQTGVPVIERIVVTPFSLGGCDFAEGDRVRIQLQSFGYAGDDRTRAAFFGAGAHACLGRPLSVDCWKALTSFMATIPLTVAVKRYSTRTTDYVFTCPAILEVNLSP